MAHCRAGDHSPARPGRSPAPPRRQPHPAGRRRCTRLSADERGHG